MNRPINVFAGSKILNAISFAGFIVTIYIFIVLGAALVFVCAVADLLERLYHKLTCLHFGTPDEKPTESTRD